MGKRRNLVQQWDVSEKVLKQQASVFLCSVPHSLFHICDPLTMGGWIIFQSHKVSCQPSELLLTEMSVRLLLPLTWICAGSSHSTAKVQDAALPTTVLPPLCPVAGVSQGGGSSGDLLACVW